MRRAILALCMALMALVHCSSGEAPTARPTVHEPLRAAYIRAVQSEQDPTYAFHSDATGLFALHPTMGMRSELDANGGVTFRAQGARLAARRVGCKDASLALVGSAPPTTRKNRVTYREGAVEAWYVNGALGLEQGWTLSGPLCAGNDELVIGVDVEGLVPRVADGGVELRDGRGLLRMHYTDLFARDAAGRDLPARMLVDGQTIAMHVDLRGARFPVEVDPLAWVEQARLVASDGGAYDQLGTAVSISGDTAVLGAPNAAGANGAAYVFTRTGASWAFQQKLTASDGAQYDGFGRAVSVSGGIIAVGAENRATSGNKNQGAAYVFTRSGNAWTEQQQLVASDGAGWALYGHAVAAGTGAVAVSALWAQIGGNTQQGAVYYYSLSGNVWTEQKLTAADGAQHDWLGDSIALAGTTLVAGAPEATIGSNGAKGAVYVFEKAGTWTQQKLTALGAGAGQVVGRTVAISGNTIAAGPGTVHVYTRGSSTWSEQDQLITSDGPNAESVAVSGTTVLVGAPKASGTNTFQGAVYVFAANGQKWNQQQKLLATDGAKDDQFGQSVAVSGTTLIVGAPNVTVGFNLNQGMAYLAAFGLSNGSPCANDTDCPSGHCADGVCCDRACNGLCQACVAASKATGLDDGVCGPVAAGKNPHNDPCKTSSPASCGPDGLCDGTGNADGTGNCRAFAPPGTVCATVCSSDHETDSACDGAQQCMPGGSKLCPNNFGCGGPKCNTTCAASTDCAYGFVCSKAGQCVAPGGTCQDDHTAVDSLGTTTRCDPYACKGGQCVQSGSCTQVGDCAAPYACDPSGKCVSATAESGGCATSGAPDTEGWWLLLGMAALIRRGRRAKREGCGAHFSAAPDAANGAVSTGEPARFAALHELGSAEEGMLMTRSPLCASFDDKENAAQSHVRRHPISAKSGTTPPV